MVEQAVEAGTASSPCPSWWSRYPLLREGMSSLPSGHAASGLLRSAELHPKDPAYRYNGRTGSYAGLLRRSLRFANGLRASGVKPGDRVAIYLPSIPEAIMAYYGVLLARAVAVPLHENCGLDEVRRRSIETGTAAIVTAGDLVREPERLAEETSVTKVIVIEETRARRLRAEALRGVPASILDKLSRKDRAVLNGNAFLSIPAPQSMEIAPHPEDLAVIQYTNGTTGPARGAILTHAAIEAGAARHAFWHEGVNAEESLRTLNAPLLHPEGLASLNASVYRSGCLELPERESRFRFEKRLTRQAGRYWLAEAASLALALPPNARAKAGALGYPLPGIEARVVGDGSFDERPVGMVGELAVRGQQLARGYWGDEGGQSSEGWIRTGDLARMEEDGCFIFAERKSHRFETMQGMVMPNEVETILRGHPAISRACVIGTKDDDGNEQALAYVVLNAERRVSPMQLQRWCRNRAGRRGTPVRFEFVRELPQTLWGEALKRELPPENRA
ncbi:AMP-binding protein [Cohnella sp. AR92]|uniref:AMP-binding protein n=1 Tax=Cohnella sp. AR92 TaxID=648716 RepID=UPI000F8C94DD|nr:class I adenylate-forming enzyme family protein [Cohnella sp. AR92]RUS46723.1 hypothetical protein ELR57_13565 [Cohnella sp. AR92]